MRNAIVSVRREPIQGTCGRSRLSGAWDKNAESVRKLALDAKAILGGYFREFTFAKRRSCGWTDCGCGAPFMPGVVLDPFMGTGTTLDVAKAAGGRGE
jgi:hypothetical protein